MYKNIVPTELLEKWKSWYFDQIGPRELSFVCKMQGISPPGFRNPEKAPFPLLKSFVQKKLVSFYENKEKAILHLRMQFPSLEKRIESLPLSCTPAEAQAIDEEIMTGDLVMALLLSEREDLHDLAVRMMEELPPFELPEKVETPPVEENPLHKENRRFSRLLDATKKEFLKKETKLQKQLAKQRNEIASLKETLRKEARLRQQQEDILHKKLREQQALRKESERAARLMEGNFKRAQAQLRKLEFRNLQLEELNRSHEEQIDQLYAEIARLQALVPVPPAVKETYVIEESVDDGIPTLNADAPQQIPEPASSTNYPQEVRGILQIPVRSRFGFLSTEQGMDLFVSEKIIFAIGAEDGDELEGHLVGEFAEGLPQYRYRISRKGVESSSHRELLGIVEERLNWVGVRDLYDDDLFIPLHAYEVPHVSTGDVVTLLFDVTHPHNNRILNVHEHLSTDEARSYRTARRKQRTNDSSRDESASEIEQTLQGVHVLICGAQSNMVSHYEQAIGIRGGSVVVLENQPSSLEPYVAKADIIICNTHQMNHPFYWVVKEEARKQNKPIFYPLSGGVTSILREAESFLAGA